MGLRLAKPSATVSEHWPGVMRPSGTARKPWPLGAIAPPANQKTISKNNMMINRLSTNMLRAQFVHDWPGVIKGKGSDQSA